MIRLIPIICMLFCSGCVQQAIKNLSANSVSGSGNLVTNEFEFADFDSLEASGVYQVEIIPADNFSVVIETDDNIAEYIHVSQDNNTLRLDLQPGSYSNLTCNATIQMPTIKKLTGSGATKFTFHEVACEELSLDLSGASKVGGHVVCQGKLDIEVSGASNVQLAGSGHELDASVSGASKLSLEELPVSTANVNSSGASHVAVSVSESIKANASGTSKIRFSGDAQCDGETSGVASIKKM